jgi:hypothetical protein
MVVHGDIISKFAILLIIIIGVVSLKSLGIVNVDSANISERSEDKMIDNAGEESEEWSFSHLLLPFIAGVVFVLVLITILLAQRKLQKKC